MIYTLTINQSDKLSVSFPEKFEKGKGNYAEWSFNGEDGEDYYLFIEKFNEPEAEYAEWLWELGHANTDACIGNGVVKNRITAELEGLAELAKVLFV